MSQLVREREPLSAAIVGSKAEEHLRSFARAAKHDRFDRFDRPVHGFNVGPLSQKGFDSDGWLQAFPLHQERREIARCWDRWRYAHA